VLFRLLPMHGMHGMHEDAITSITDESETIHSIANTYTCQVKYDGGESQSKGVISRPTPSNQPSHQRRCSAGRAKHQSNQITTDGHKDTHVHPPPLCRYSSSPSPPSNDISMCNSNSTSISTSNRSYHRRYWPPRTPRPRKGCCPRQIFISQMTNAAPHPVQLTEAFTPTSLHIRNDSSKHRHHHAMRQIGGGDGETRTRRPCFRPMLLPVDPLLIIVSELVLLPQTLPSKSSLNSLRERYVVRRPSCGTRRSRC
jgi:hypothetical protein